MTWEQLNNKPFQDTAVWEMKVHCIVVNKDLTLRARAKAKDLTAKAKAKDSRFVLEDSSKPRTKAKDNNTGSLVQRVTGPNL